MSARVHRRRGDALFEHIQLQLAALLRTARARGGFLSGEDAATAAAFMRVCAIHARGLELDEEARRVLTIRARDVGRDALINLPPDSRALRSRMRRKGLRDQRSAGRSAGRDRPRDARGGTPGDPAGTDDSRLRSAGGRVRGDRADPRQRARRRSLRIAAPDEAWCNFLVGQWTMFLSIAWYIASFHDPALQAFLDAMWSGSSLYETLYLQQC